MSPTRRGRPRLAFLAKRSFSLRGAGRIRCVPPVPQPPEGISLPGAAAEVRRGGLRQLPGPGEARQRVLPPVCVKPFVKRERRGGRGRRSRAPPDVRRREDRGTAVGGRRAAWRQRTALRGRGVRHCSSAGRCQRQEAATPMPKCARRSATKRASTSAGKNAPARFPPSSRSTAASPLTSRASTDISLPTLRRRSRKMVEAPAAAGEASSTTPGAPRSRPNRPPEGSRTRQADVAPDKPAPARPASATDGQHHRRGILQHGRLVRLVPMKIDLQASAPDPRRGTRNREGARPASSRAPPSTRTASPSAAARTTFFSPTARGAPSPGWRTEIARRQERASRAGVGNRGQAGSAAAGPFSPCWRAATRPGQTEVNDRTSGPRLAPHCAGWKIPGRRQRRASRARPRCAIRAGAGRALIDLLAGLSRYRG